MSSPYITGTIPDHVKGTVNDPFAVGVEDPFVVDDGGGMSAEAGAGVASSACGLANALVSGIINAAIYGSKKSMMASEKQMATDRADAQDECARADADIAKDTMEMKGKSADYAVKAKEMEKDLGIAGARIDGQKKVEDAKAREFAKNEKAAEGGDSKKARDGLRHFGATGYFYG